MTINQLTVFAQNGEKNTTGLTQADGFPSTQKPARQWFNWLFNAMTTKINELVNAQNGQLSTLYPVGIVVEFSVNTNPNTIWPNTTWVRFAEGKTTVGYKESDTDFGTIGQTGGKKGHKMTLLNLILHDHDTVKVITVSGDAQESDGAKVVSGETQKTSSTGQADPDAIPTLPPYVVVAKWVRTA